jgi:hypothetical protein
LSVNVGAIHSQIFSKTWGEDRTRGAPLTGSIMMGIMRPGTCRWAVRTEQASNRRLSAVGRSAMGRKKLYHSRITLPLERETLAAIDAKRGGVARVDFIREAIKRHLRRPSKGAEIGKSRKGRRS